MSYCCYRCPGFALKPSWWLPFRRRWLLLFRLSRQLLRFRLSLRLLRYPRGLLHLQVPRNLRLPRSLLGEISALMAIPRIGVMIPRRIAQTWTFD